jgi:hypothetical protein
MLTALCVRCVTDIHSVCQDGWHLQLRWLRVACVPPSNERIFELLLFQPFGQASVIRISYQNFALQAANLSRFLATDRPREHGGVTLGHVLHIQHQVDGGNMWTSEGRTDRRQECSTQRRTGRILMGRGPIVGGVGVKQCSWETWDKLDTSTEGTMITKWILVKQCSSKGSVPSQNMCVICGA